MTMTAPKEERPGTMSRGAWIARSSQCGAMAMNEAEAAEAGVGRDSIYDGIRAGALEVHKLGRRTIITRDALQRLLDTLPALKLPAGQQGAPHDVPTHPHHTEKRCASCGSARQRRSRNRT